VGVLPFSAYLTTPAYAAGHAEVFQPYHAFYGATAVDHPALGGGDLPNASRHPSQVERRSAHVPVGSIWRRTPGRVIRCLVKWALIICRTFWLVAGYQQTLSLRRNMNVEFAKTAMRG